MAPGKDSEKEKNMEIMITEIKEKEKWKIENKVKIIAKYRQ